MIGFNKLNLGNLTTALSFSKTILSTVDLTTNIFGLTNDFEDEFPARIGDATRLVEKDLFICNVFIFGTYVAGIVLFIFIHFCFPSLLLLSFS